jgi:hypothetical protein
MYHSGINLGTRCSLPASYSILIDKYLRQNRKNAKFPLILLFYRSLLTPVAHQNIHELWPKRL